MLSVTDVLSIMKKTKNRFTPSLPHSLITFSWLYKLRLLLAILASSIVSTHTHNYLATRFHKGTDIYMCCMCSCGPSAVTQETEEENGSILVACEQESTFSIRLTKILTLIQVTGQHMEVFDIIHFSHLSE